VARRDDVDAHPTHPALVVEIADSGLRMARGRMAAAYPRARIAGADLTITPLAAPGATFQTLNPNLPSLPDFVAGQAVALGSSVEPIVPPFTIRTALSLIVPPLELWYSHST